MNEKATERAPASEPLSSEDQAADEERTVPTTPELPPIAAKADDLNEIKKAVEDSTTVSGGLWFSYLFAVLYLAVAAGAVTHIDLFLERPVKLPFLGVELPLFWFFLIAPILFLISHFYILQQLFFLSAKAKIFHEALCEQLGGDRSLPDIEREQLAAIREKLRWQLPNNIFIQFLAGPSEIRTGLFGWSLRAIGWITLVIAPVVLLLLFQVQFLPFHNSFVTWIQRVSLIADLVVIWWLWRKILSGCDGLARSQLWASAGRLLSVGVILFSCSVATFPGERQEEFVRNRDMLKYLALLHDWVFNSEVNETTRHRWAPFSATLVLSGVNIYEELGVGDPENAKWRDFVFHARGRDLNGAWFDNTVMRKVDFEGAQLNNAVFFRSQLHGASFIKAELQGANFLFSQIPGAMLEQALLEGASLMSVQGQGADFANAKLQAARLDGSDLQGASLAGAQLQVASLQSAKLQGAQLDNAQLQGASLVLSQLQGASFEYASFEATDLSHAFLWRSDGGGPSTFPNWSTAARVASVKLADAGEAWSPIWSVASKAQPWNNVAYQDLLITIKALPSNDLRQTALNHIQRLDCANSDPTLASCDPSVQAPSEELAWKTSLEKAKLDDSTYAKALATTLKSLICSGHDNAHIILSSLIARPLGIGMVPAFRATYFTNPLLATGLEKPALIDFVMSKECPVSSSLTNTDRSFLQQIRQDTSTTLGY